MHYTQEKKTFLLLQYIFYVCIAKELQHCCVQLGKTVQN